MKFEFVIIYKPALGAKYDCINVVAHSAAEAKSNILNAYEHLIADEDIVAVVQLGQVGTPTEHLFDCIDKLITLADDLQNDTLYTLAHEVKATADIILSEE